MEAYIKKKLEERNHRIIEAIIKKAENVCPGAIALIGIAGSFHSGDIYEKSDLDLCIVINDDSAWKVASCFILEDVAFDIYCTPWSGLEEISEDAIKGTYEEIYSNWNNKMYHAADKDDTYLSLMTAASCQNFYDQMYSKYNIDKIDFMKNIAANNLILSAEIFDNAMEEYKKNYDKVRTEIKCYTSLDEFERKYLGEVKA